MSESESGHLFADCCQSSDDRLFWYCSSVADEGALPSSGRPGRRDSGRGGGHAFADGGVPVNVTITKFQILNINKEEVHKLLPECRYRAPE